MSLSIIIPCYNAEPYINELLDCLNPQIVPEVEVILIDDGSRKPFKTDYKWCQVIRQKNQGASAARNTGLDHAKNDYIAFIDADDLVVNNFIETIINKAKTDKFDYCYMSWKTFGGWNQEVRLRNIEDKFPPFNLCVWNRIYKRSMIGDIRFNTNKVVAEDAQFIRDVKEEGKKKAFIPDIMYLYRCNTPNSLTKQVSSGILKHKRIVYNLPIVPDDPKLLKEIKEADKTAEVIVLTGQNNLKDLEKYAMVIPPRDIVGTELRGNPTTHFRKQPEPYRTQVLLYVDNLFEIGGIETFTYNFCYYLHRYYDIAVAYTQNIAEKQRLRLLPFADIVKISNQPIVCDTAINCRMVLHLPDVIKARYYMNLVHTCKMQPGYMIKDSQNDTYFVSKAAAESFDYPEGRNIIYNLTIKPEVKTCPIRLVSACRLSWEKGKQRILDLAEMINRLGISFTWEVFTDQIPEVKCADIPDGLVFRHSRLDVLQWVKAADFYVSLSSYESFGFSIVEALELGIPVITTPLPVLSEIGLIDGLNGYIVPMEIKAMSPDYLRKILERKLSFSYDRTEDNKKIVDQWRSILGDTTPTRKHNKDDKLVKVLKDHTDGELKRKVRAGEYLLVRPTRAKAGIDAGFYEVV